MIQEEIEEGLWNKTMRIREIVKKANDLCNDPKNDNKSTEDLCVMAAEWADKTMIDKACEWLKSYRQDTYDGTGYISGIVNDKTIEEFKQAMEE